MRNYVQIDKFSLRYRYFCYVDVKQYLADELFKKNRIRVWFTKEYGKEDKDYIAIMCKVYKRDAKKFEALMPELEKKMLLMGYTDYAEICGELGW